MNLCGRRIHIVGSADPEEDEKKLKYVHTLVSELTVALAVEGTTFVIPFGKEPLLKDRTDGPSIIFDWTVAELCERLANEGRRVILAGLDMDFRGEPFGPMPLLMAQAEAVDKLQAICMVCGEPATRTQRLVNGKPARFDDPVVIVGASEMYEARCRKHHEVPKE